MSICVQEMAESGQSLRPVAEKLRRAGCQGKHKQNIERDCMVTLGKRMDLATSKHCLGICHVMRP